MVRSLLFAISGERTLARPASKPGREAAVRNGERHSPWTRLGVCFLHLAVLSSLGLAQPLFDILGRNPEFFAVRGSPSRDIVAFAFAVTLVPPTALLVPEALAALVSRRLHAGLHLLFVAGLSAVVAIQVVKRVGSFSVTPSLAASVLLGAAAALAYARLRFVRLTLTALAPVPLVFLGLFLLGTPVKKLVLPEEEKLRLANVSSETPIVVVVFDELPVTSLMERNGGIDAVRYPNFAALARDSVWFRNTAAVSGGTVRAVPAILTGVYSTRGLPIYADYPRNLFTLLGRRYRIRASEQMTRLCPPALCEDAAGESFTRRTESLARDVAIVYGHLVLPDGLRDRLPSISDTWLDFGRETAAAPPYAAPARPRRSATRVRDRASSFERFVDSIRPGRRPALHYVHLLLPHQPWHYFPSGREYLTDREILRPFGEDGRWPTDRTAVRQAFQRHLLQVQFVDRLLGRLLARLRKVGMYDRSLVVVTSDHGVSFRPGDRRRKETSTNVEDMAPVPLFVKLPGRRRGDVDDRQLQTTDILPTIADVIDTPIPWRIQGRSAFAGPARERILIGDMTVDAGALARRHEQALARQIALFGYGKEPPGLYGLGPHPELIGERVATLPRVTASADRADLAGVVAERLSDVPREPLVVPAPLAGTVTGPGAGAGRGIAAAVNGRIAAVSETFSDSGSVGFSMLAPDSVFRPGANRVELFWIVDGPGGVALESLGGFPS